MERELFKPVSTNAGASISGPEAGLNRKIKYWAERDFQYEFGVTLGQAMNLAFGTLKNDPTPTKELVMQIFSTLLEYRLDPDFVGAFADYYENKMHKNDPSKPSIPTVRY